MSDASTSDKRVETGHEREQRQPGLCIAAEAFCIYGMTDGFCHPRNNGQCKCWQAAEDTMRATGLSAQAAAYVYRTRERIEREAEHDRRK